MPEYTPSMNELRDLWVDHKLDPLPRSQGIPLVPTVQAEFDRFIAGIRGEAKAEALQEAIKAVRDVYEIQCPVKPGDSYIHPSVRIAHKWWETVLGGKLHDLDRRAEQYKEQS